MAHMSTKGIQIKGNIYTDKGEEDDIFLGNIENIKEIKESKEYLIELRKINILRFFKEYCQLYIEIGNKGKITRQTAAYIIAGSMFDRGLKEIPEIEEIVTLAGILELPYQHATDNGDKQTYDTEWNKLVDKIRNLKY